MKTLDDIKTHFKDTDTIQHPNTNLTCKFCDVIMIWDNGTGGYNGFIKNGDIIILYSGKSNSYSSIVEAD